MKKHRGFWHFVRIVIILICFWAFENYTIHTENVHITSGKITEPITIVQLTDLHGQRFGDNNKRLIDRINKAEPDLIMVTGDMYSSTDSTSAGRDTAIRLMSSLSAPVYFVPGEHDRNDEFMDSLRENGVNVLENDSVTINVNGNDLCIYGVDTVYFTPKTSIESKFPDIDTDIYNILLAHIPNYNLYMTWKADLVLNGDTHGGLMQIPFAGPLYFEGEWLPELLQKRVTYDKGLFEKNGKYMYVSAGLGSYPLPVRLFNRPELTVITINPD